MKVFISHDSRDKDRFVKNFACKLLDNGVDVWYDDWELGYGDSLMAIFEAISQCDVFISVISEYSVGSKWVKEESDSAFIKKIEDNVKFIPVILPGDFEIPDYLNHIVQCRIKNINDYDGEINRLISDIFGISLKPKIGSKPRYALVSPINQLEQCDTIVLKVMGDFFLKNNVLSVSFEKIVELVHDFDINDESIMSSLEFLKDMNYCDYIEVMGSDNPVNIRLLYKGAVLYCKNYVDNFKFLIKKILSAIFNENIMDEEDIIQKTNIAEFIVDAILDCLDDKNYIIMTKTFDGAIIHKISGTGKRYMKKILEDSHDDSEDVSEIILPNCNKKETSIFKELCGYCLDKSFDIEIDPMVILNLVDKYYDEDDFDKLQERVAYSLRNLEKNNYITTAGGSIGMAFLSKSITAEGFCFYLKNFVEDKSIYSNVIRAILVGGLSTIGDISKKYDILQSIVDMLVKLFRKNGYIVCNNDLTDITVTPAGEEYFEEILHNSQ